MTEARYCGTEANAEKPCPEHFTDFACRGIFSKCLVAWINLERFFGSLVSLLVPLQLRYFVSNEELHLTPDPVLANEQDWCSAPRAAIN